jgi:glycosidase
MEMKDPRSLLRFIGNLTKRRKASPEIDNGSWQVLKTPDALLVLLSNDKGKRVLTIHNFSLRAEKFRYNGHVYSSVAPLGADWRRLN